jgi:hypothetical protein
MTTQRNGIGRTKIFTAHAVPDTMSNANLYTRKEVALLAKVSVRTVARDVRFRRLEEISFNRRRLRYHPDAVRAYLKGFSRGQSVDYAK